MESAASAYRRLMREESFQEAAKTLFRQMQKLAQTAGTDFESYKREHWQELEKLYLPQDLKAICDLLDKGYSLREVTEAYTDQNLFAMDMGSTDLVKIYEDKVLGLVNNERQKRSGAEFDRANKAYHDYASAADKKYDHHEKVNPDYRVGEIVIAMMMRDGFAESTIVDVLESNADHDSAYIKSMMEKCGHVKQAYLDIERAGSLDDARNEYDVYRTFTKGYMARTEAKFLTYEDELEIVKTMQAEDFPEEFLKNALMKASPVALEPGRDANAYAEAVLSGDNDLAKGHSLNGESIVGCNDYYMDFIETAQKDLLEKGIVQGITDDNRPYYDCLAVRQLLQKHYPEKDIMMAINKFSGRMTGSRPNYAIWMLEKAKKLMKKEQNWMQKNLPKIEKGMTYAQLAAAGIAAVAIVAGILHERLALNPSLEQNLHATFLDKDLAEACLNRYPDFDKEALQGVFADSPRAIVMSGNRSFKEQEYGERIVAEAEKRLAKHSHQVQEQKSVFEEFNKQHGLSYQGITPQDNVSAFHYGRTALQLMIKGYDEFAIRNAILLTDAPEDRPPEKFADEIIDKTRKVHGRLQNIKNYVDTNEVPAKMPETAADFYQQRIHQEYSRRHFVKSSMDVDIVKDMLAYGKWTGRQMREAIMEFSPIAIEPGRDAGYFADYVLPNAKNRLMDEKDKLNNYHPVPRQQHSDSAAEEYDYHRDRILQAIDLPFNSQMDELIAETMLIQGFDVMELADVIQQNSPCQDGQESYGLNLVNHARYKKSAIQEAEEREMPAGQTLVRTITETTEITETTTTETTEVESA